MNQQAYYEDRLLMKLRDVDSIRTLDLEKKLDCSHPQYANNIISNRYNETSFIKKGYMKYDDTEQTISITEEGRKYLENKYPRKRK